MCFKKKKIEENKDIINEKDLEKVNGGAASRTPHYKKDKTDKIIIPIHPDDDSIGKDK